MPAQSVKLLALDDEPGILDLIQDHFSPRGYEVFTAGDGLEGVELCERVRPDIILLDLKMKKMDGDEAIPHLRKIVPHAIVVVISAYQDEVTRRRIAGLGVDVYFEKPVSILNLEKTVHQLLI